MTATPQTGQTAPEFRLRGPGGQFVSLSEYRGKKNVVVVFFPLAFSPVCSHQLPEVEKVVPRLEALDAVVLGVSVDSYYANEAFARSLGLSFPLLSDFDRSASQAWGILIPERNYSGRALFLVDKQGRLAYVDVAPTPSKIPSNEALIAALERLG
ncbi:MAG TPA: redoxin domain-containing protein, partial [Candidatus Eisenbacteria bacterium]